MTVLPFFLPNLGCPGRCVFCDQGLSGASALADPAQAEGFFRSAISALAPAQKEGGVELAFFGGSFTGLPLATQQELLAQAGRLLDEGLAQSLRVSTHPGLLDPAALDLLVRGRVTTVELGIQSTDDAVLARCGRGHSRAQALEACGRVRLAGLNLGVQLMPGLPGADAASDLQSARDLAALAPQEFRLYPCLVLKGTPLEGLWAAGTYQPLSVEEAVTRCAAALEVLLACGAHPLRLGLLDQPALALSVVAGPAHPALGELVWSHYLAARLAYFLTGHALEIRTLRLQRALASLFLGHRRRGLELLGRLSGRTLDLELADFAAPAPDAPGWTAIPGAFAFRQEGPSILVARAVPIRTPTAREGVCP
jgi:histone acetyltransferase (RNA polymerase elongator complex component)